MNAKQPHDFLLSNFNAGKIRTPTHIRFLFEIWRLMRRTPCAPYVELE